MFAEDFMPKPEPCPGCGKVLTDGKLCINCTHKMEDIKNGK